MLDVDWPFGHKEHELTTENGLTSGFNMNDAEGQHPRRPVLVNLLLDFVDSHAPPHKVRLNPLNSNTAVKRAKKKETAHEQSNRQGGEM